MKTRIITGVLLALLLAVALYFGGVVCSVLLILCVCLSMYEMYKALNFCGHKCLVWPAGLCVLLSVPLFMYVKASVSLIVTMAAATSMLITTFIMIRSEPKLEDIGASLLPMVSVLIPGMCLLGIVRNAHDADGSRLLELTLLVLSFGVPLFGDMLAYFIGRKYGRTKLCPAVSPNKTVEGAVAGLVGSIIFAIACYLIFGIFGTVNPFWHFLLLGLFAGLAGQTGDLFASIIKRHCGVKDYGNIFPGHGGMMDRLDSVYWASVIIYIYLNWISY